PSSPKALGNNLCPASRECVQFLEFLGGKPWGGHCPSCLEVAPRATEAFPVPHPKQRKPSRKPRRGLAPKNRRKGHSQKTVSGDMGDLHLRTPRDRNGTFEPQLVAKGQRRLD